jgi:hypothetical protein
VKVANLASALRAEVRRLAAKELRKALRPLGTVQKQIRKLRTVSRTQKKSIRAIERGFDRLQSRVGTRGGRRGRGGLSPEAIRSLRSQLGMSRAAFAKLVGVSPGSIFGWETGRTIPRGRSMTRVVEVKKMGVRKARARLAGGPRKVVRRNRRRPRRRAA